MYLYTCREEWNTQKKCNAVGVHQISVFIFNLYNHYNFVLLLNINVELLCLSPELIHKGTKDDQQDYLFYLAVANYKLKVVISCLHWTLIVGMTLWISFYCFILTLGIWESSEIHQDFTEEWTWKFSSFRSGETH